MKSHLRLSNAQLPKFNRVRWRASEIREQDQEDTLQEAVAFTGNQKKESMSLSSLSAPLEIPSELINPEHLSYAPRFRSGTAFYSQRPSPGNSFVSQKSSTGVCLLSVWCFL
ncbi:unnamed protein product [Pleuronectes platessa]|uniref:Uncharacterized protein n=1 Tax=Pleuronectes platessa TaxID=8262 RepID=A0A9N7Y687_PLEPL|nr:unnamed protein product [Pleuronectes platessa]